MRQLEDADGIFRLLKGNCCGFVLLLDVRVFRPKTQATNHIFKAALLHKHIQTYLWRIYYLANQGIEDKNNIRQEQEKKNTKKRESERERQKKISILPSWRWLYKLMIMMRAIMKMYVLSMLAAVGLQIQYYNKNNEEYISKCLYKGFRVLRIYFSCSFLRLFIFLFIFF